MPKTLKEQLTDISASAGASLIPGPRQGRQKREPEQIPDLRELDIAASDRNKLVRLLEERQPWAEAKAQADKELARIVDEIKPIAVAWGLEKFMEGILKVSLIEVPRISTDRDALIREMTNAGLQPKVVNAILGAVTKTTKSWQLRVVDTTKPRERRGKDDEEEKE